MIYESKRKERNRQKHRGQGKKGQTKRPCGCKFRRAEASRMKCQGVKMARVKSDTKKRGFRASEIQLDTEQETARRLQVPTGRSVKGRLISHQSFGEGIRHSLRVAIGLNPPLT